MKITMIKCKCGGVYIVVSGNPESDRMPEDVFWSDGVNPPSYSPSYYCSDCGDKMGSETLHGPCIRLVCKSCGNVLSNNESQSILKGIGYDINNDSSGKLTTAVARGDIAELRQLISNGADVNEKEYGGDAPLHRACRYIDGLPIVKLLISKGTDVNLEGKGPRSYPRSDGHTPLQVAASAGHRDVVELLVSNGANIDKGGLFSSPLTVAAQAGHMDVVELLISAGANIYEEEFYSPFRDALWAGHMKIAELLISKGANINAKKDNGDTFLHDTVKDSHSIRIVERLITVGADINAKNNNGDTPYDIAKKARFNKNARNTSEDKQRYQEIMALLRKHGAKGGGWLNTVLDTIFSRFLLFV